MQTCCRQIEEIGAVVSGDIFLILPHFAVLFDKKIVHAQSIMSLKDIHFKLLKNGEKFQEQTIFNYIAQQHFGGRSYIERSNLIPQRHNCRALATYS